MTGSVLTFGEPLIICIPKHRAQLSSNREFDLDFGGAELNTAVGLARLDIPTTFAGMAGDDPFGRWIRRELRAEDIDVTELELSERDNTGVVFKLSTPMVSDPSVFYYRSATPMTLGQWEPSSVMRRLVNGNFSWVHTTGITWMLASRTSSTAQKIVGTACEAGVEVSFDVNFRRKLGTVEEWRNIVEKLLPYISWLFVGDDEALLLWGVNEACNLENLVRSLGFRGHGLVLKCGHRGADASVNGHLTHVPAWPITQVVDTVGAGDGFNAGWLAGMLRGMNLQQAMKLGSIVGAFAVSSSGDSSGYPHWKDAINLLEGVRGTVR